MTRDPGVWLKPDPGRVTVYVPRQPPLPNLEESMIVVRFKVECQTAKTEQVEAVLREVIAPSRALAGVISFDIGRDLTDANSFIATEVFEDRGALDRQESQAEVANALAVLGESLVAEPEATIFHVSSAEPYGD